MKFSKNVNDKKHAPKLIFFNEKKIEKDSDNFWHRKLTLKVRNCHLSIAWFRAEVDLTKNLFYEKALFFTQLSYHLMCRLLKKSYMLSNIHISNCSFGRGSESCNFCSFSVLKMWEGGGQKSLKMCLRNIWMVP